MKTNHMYLSLYVLSTVAVLANSIEPVTTMIFVGAGAVLGRRIINYFRESCDPKWIAFNSTGEWVLLCLAHVPLPDGTRFCREAVCPEAVVCGRSFGLQHLRCQNSSKRQAAVLRLKHNPNWRRGDTQAFCSVIELNKKIYVMCSF